MSGSLQNLLESNETLKRPARPYAPTRRVTPASSVLVPISRVELVQCQTTANPLRTRPKPAPAPLPPSSSSTSAPLPQPPSSLPARPDLALAYQQHQHQPPPPPQSHKRPNTYGSNGYGYGDHDSKRSKATHDTRTVADHCPSFSPLSPSSTLSSCPDLTRTRPPPCAQTTRAPTRTGSRGATRPSSGSRTSTTGSRASSSQSLAGARATTRRGSGSSTSGAARAATCTSGRGPAPRSMSGSVRPYLSPRPRSPPPSCSSLVHEWRELTRKPPRHADIAAVSIAQAQQRYDTMRGQRFPARFFTLDCFEVRPPSLSPPPPPLLLYYKDSRSPSPARRTRSRRSSRRTRSSARSTSSRCSSACTTRSRPRPKCA